ncbi:peptidylprolyl isomerase [Lentibacillus amyloliquefaciens]|uniref:peptidylprolyl isomerase n=1 Tax=Lentibacillus amyloliquefaciens TaxID=1472767 RepID=A0A0U3W8K6_9BACI|nr:peptidyl-prolyl cis-trans isomerase [Lentibacillus amyloliquefaciens]ALX49426.1 protein secretion protein [Lentibacillus amyloliquefaciens]
MNRNLLLGIIAVLLVTNIATFIFWSQEETISLDDSGSQINQKEPVATVGEETISYDEWTEALRGNHGEKQLEDMINQQAVEQLAERNNITIDEKVINRELALLTTMQGIMTEEETQQKEEEWREDIIYRYQLEALLTDEIDIPDEEVRAYYEQYQDQYNVQASTQISHIVVEDFETAEKVHQEIEDGGSFDLLAREYSIDEETKDEGGYFEFLVNSSQFWPDGYLDKAEQMEERTYSEPFETNQGVAIIYLHRKLPAITFDYEEIKPYVERELAMDELDNSLSAAPLWNELNIEWIYGEE